MIGESGGGGGDALQAGARGADLYDNLVSAGYVSGAGGGGGAGTPALAELAGALATGAPPAAQAACFKVARGPRRRVTRR